MGIFSRSAIVKAPPEPSVETRCTRAEAEVNQCRAEIDALGERYNDLVTRYHLVRDQWGNIKHLEVPDSSNYAAVLAEVRGLENEHNRAVKKFNAALSVWAAAKGELENATGSRTTGN